MAIRYNSPSLLHIDLHKRSNFLYAFDFSLTGHWRGRHSLCHLFEISLLKYPFSHLPSVPWQQAFGTSS